MVHFYGGQYKCNLFWWLCRTGVQTKAELWNGSAWTETGDINTARYNGGLVELIQEH